MAAVGAGGALAADAQRGKRLAPEVNRVLLVKNLSYNITPAEIYDVFGKYGCIRQVRWMCAWRMLAAAPVFLVNVVALSSNVAAAPPAAPHAPPHAAHPATTPLGSHWIGKGDQGHGVCRVRRHLRGQGCLRTFERLQRARPLPRCPLLPGEQVPLGVCLSPF